MINLKEVAKSYNHGRVAAVDHLSLQVRAGELVVLLGESGCGKTTTLKMINRLIEPTSGVVEVDGIDNRTVDAVHLRRSIGYVFQGIGLFPHLTVGQNIAVVPGLLGWEKAQTAKRVHKLLSLVGLEPDEYRDRYPRALSGGQRQRIGVARALSAKPKIMLMDEPFGALDPLTRDTLQDEFVKIHKQLELTTVMVTHDMTEALLMADRIAVISGGRVLQYGSPHTMLTEPVDDYVKSLMQMPKRQADRLEALAEGPSAG